ncbi:hypothetical protein DYB32_004628 [Aphanomyces invadans]|uniref:Uncharacterized protein n=1 Tax=Aphanomyces invadans TaxID=157072 RepID=A0A418AWY9_9STRA|nr:hypothetical protein DYB32_004628 [Aphanomyces invadans]
MPITAEHRNVEAILDHIAVDVHFRVTLLDAKCYELRKILHMYAVTSPEEAAAKENDAEANVEEKDDIQGDVAAAESALQNALLRARAIRNAPEIKKRTKLQKADSLQSTLTAPREHSPTTRAVAGRDTIPSQDQERPPRQHPQPKSLPRHMLAKIAEVVDKTAIWSSPDSPAKVFLGKLNQLVSQRDAASAAGGAISPPRIPYREQVFRLQYAYDRILSVVAKCCSYMSSSDTPPSLSRVFPVWYRLHKIKKLLVEMNEELTSLLK